MTAVSSTIESYKLSTDIEVNVVFSELMQLSKDDSRELDVDTSNLSAVTICFKVPLPRCGVKAVPFTPGELQSFQNFNTTIANTMSVVPKDVKVGYTLPWIKVLKKDVNSRKCIRVINNEVTLRDMANRIEQHLVDEVKVRSKKSKDGSALNIQMIANGYTITLHSLREVWKGAEPKTQPRTSIVSLFSGLFAHLHTKSI